MDCSLLMDWRYIHHYHNRWRAQRVCTKRIKYRPHQYQLSSMVCVLHVHTGYSPTNNEHSHCGEVEESSICPLFSYFNHSIIRLFEQSNRYRWRISHRDRNSKERWKCTCMVAEAYLLPQSRNHNKQQPIHNQVCTKPKNLHAPSRLLVWETLLSDWSVWANTTLMGLIHYYCDWEMFLITDYWMDPYSCLVRELCSLKRLAFINSNEKNCADSGFTLADRSGSNKWQILRLQCKSFPSFAGNQ